MHSGAKSITLCHKNSLKFKRWHVKNYLKPQKCQPDITVNLQEEVKRKKKTKSLKAPQPSVVDTAAGDREDSKRIRDEEGEKK